VDGSEVLLLLEDVLVLLVLSLSICVADLVSVLLFGSRRVLLHHARKVSSLEDFGLKVSYLKLVIIISRSSPLLTILI
jgi:hypothetical protein